MVYHSESTTQTRAPRRHTRHSPVSGTAEPTAAPCRAMAEAHVSPRGDERPGGSDAALRILEPHSVIAGVPEGPARTAWPCASRVHACRAMHSGSVLLLAGRAPVDPRLNANRRRHHWHFALSWPSRGMRRSTLGARCRNVSRPPILTHASCGRVPALLAPLSVRCKARDGSMGADIGEHEDGRRLRAGKAEAQRSRSFAGDSPHSARSRSRPSSARGRAQSSRGTRGCSLRGRQRSAVGQHRRRVLLGHARGGSPA